MSIYPTERMLKFLRDNFLPVASAGIQAGAVIADKISDLAVTTTKLADLSVITGKIADYAVTGIKIAAGAVTPDKLSGPLLRAYMDSPLSVTGSADTILTGWTVADETGMSFDETTGIITYTEAGLYQLDCAIEAPDAPNVSLRHEWSTDNGATWYQNLRGAELADTTGTNRVTVDFHGLHNVTSGAVAAGAKSRFVLWHNGATQNANSNSNLANTRLFAVRIR